MDFSNISELLSTLSKYVNNPQNSNNDPIINTEAQNTQQQQANKLYSNSFPEPLNITQNNVLHNKIHTQNNVEQNKTQTFTNNNTLNFKDQTQQHTTQNNFSNPLSELTKFLNPDTLKFVQQFLPLINNLKGNNILSGFTNLIQGNKKNNTNPINVVSNKNEIDDIESLIRIDSN